MIKRDATARNNCGGVSADIARAMRRRWPRSRRARRDFGELLKDRAAVMSISIPRGIVGLARVKRRIASGENAIESP